MGFGGGFVQIRLGVKGQHPQSIVHHVKRFIGQKRDLSPVGPAPKTASEMSITPEENIIISQYFILRLKYFRKRVLHNLLFKLQSK